MELHLQDRYCTAKTTQEDFLAEQLSAAVSSIFHHQTQTTVSSWVHFRNMLGALTHVPRILYDVEGLSQKT